MTADGNLSHPLTGPVISECSPQAIAEQVDAARRSLGLCELVYILAVNSGANPGVVRAADIACQELRRAMPPAPAQSADDPMVPRLMGVLASSPHVAHRHEAVALSVARLDSGHMDVINILGDLMKDSDQRVAIAAKTAADRACKDQ